MDYQGTQYWSDEITVIPNQENLIGLNLEQLALDLTNDPLAVRFDGVAPVYMSGPIRVATLGSLTGLLAQGVIAQTPEEKVYYYITDHLGTPQKVVDSAGVVVWSGDYSPFGEVTSGVSTVQNNFRFPGQYFDEETGLHYNYHRYYQSRLGRYLTPDPLFSSLAPGGADFRLLHPLVLTTPDLFNPFSYVFCDPVNRMDTLGLSPFDILKCLYYGTKVSKAQSECKNEMDEAVKGRPKYMSECEAEAKWVVSYGQGTPSDAILECAKRRVGPETYGWWLTNCMKGPLFFSPKPR